MKNKPAVSHTPTPWTLNGNAITSWVSKDGDHICFAEMSKLSKAQNWAQDAAFIVRAVNSHDELLKAMRKAVKRLRDGDGSDSFFPEQDSEAIEIIEQAIAKAEGK